MSSYSLSSSKKQKRLTSFFSSNKKPANESNKSNKRLRTEMNKSSFGTCPLCLASFPLHRLQLHATSCNGEMKKLSSLQSSRNEDRSLKNVQEPIPGLFIYEDFITEDEEAAILNFLNREDNLPWKAAKFNGKNNGKRWGVHCNLRDRRVDAPENPLPDFILNMLIPKLKRLSCTKGCIPNEANAIQYYREKGDWLHPHVDDRKLSKEPIANLSLAGDCIMTFTNQAMHRNLAVKEEKVLLKRRCLQVLTGKARYDFSHGIQNQDLLSDWRVSVTMRESPLTSS